MNNLALERDFKNFINENMKEEDKGSYCLNGKCSEAIRLRGSVDTITVLMSPSLFHKFKEQSLTFKFDIRIKSYQGLTNGVIVILNAKDHLDGQIEYLKGLPVLRAQNT